MVKSGDVAGCSFVLFWNNTRAICTFNHNIPF